MSSDPRSQMPNMMFFRPLIFTRKSVQVTKSFIFTCRSMVEHWKWRVTFFLGVGHSWGCFSAHCWCIFYHNQKSVFLQDKVGIFTTMIRKVELEIWNRCRIAWGIFFSTIFCNIFTMHGVTAKSKKLGVVLFTFTLCDDLPKNDAKVLQITFPESLSRPWVGISLHSLGNIAKIEKNVPKKLCQFFTFVNFGRYFLDDADIFTRRKTGKHKMNL
jgi:hypothetical protein